MDDKLSNLLDEFFNTLDKDLEDYKYLKKDLLDNKDLLNKISKLHNLNKFDPEYKEIKQELFKNEEYKKFLKYENELLLLSLMLTNKLKELIEGDFNESN